VDGFFFLRYSLSIKEQLDVFFLKIPPYCK
jgi:hypothetical protein